MSRPFQKRNCDFCGRYYEGVGLRFCSLKCVGAWSSTHPTKTLAERFWSKVDKSKPDGCWLWIAGKHTDGYGIIGINGKTEKAHRVVWELVYGTIPKGQCVLHHCDVPACCNPNHLFLGSQQDNIADMVSKGRQSAARGENSGNSKLTKKDVLIIRSLEEQGICQLEIANKFSIDPSTVYKIVLRKSWKHI